ncbi:MAG: SlyX family protein [Bdellovibrionales bacterium]
MPDNKYEHDIQNLQETVAHQDQQINDLSDMIIAQGSAIDALKKEVNKLQGKLEQMGDDAPEADQKPPHY